MLTLLHTIQAKGRRWRVITPARQWLASVEPVLLPSLLAFDLAHLLNAQQVQGWQGLYGWILIAMVLMLTLRILMAPFYRRIFVPLSVVCIIAGFLFGIHHLSNGIVQKGRHRLPQGQLITLTGTAYPDSKGWQLQTDDARLAVRGKNARENRPVIASQVRVTGWFQPPRPPLFPGAFDEVRFLGGAGLQGSFLPTEPPHVLSDKPPSWPDLLLRHLENIRQRLQRQLIQTLGPQQGALVGGLVLGERAIALPPEEQTAFRRTGLTHFLAASGMNVALITGAVAGLLVLCRLPARLVILLTLPVVLFYCGLTGWPPSIQRAGLMVVIALILKAFNRRLSGPLLLASALTGLLIIQPLAFWSLGLQLSVLTTWGLITWVPFLIRQLGPWITRPIAGALLLPTIAQLWAAPLVITVFNQLPLHSVLMNLLAEWLIAPLTLLGFAGAALTFLWEPFGVAIWWLTQPLTSLLLALVHWGAGFQAAQWGPASLPLWSLLSVYGALLIPSLGWHRRFQWPAARMVRAMAVGVILATLPFVWKSLQPKRPTLTHLPLSEHTSATLLQARQTARPWVILPTRVNEWEARQLASYCRHHGLVPQGWIALSQRLQPDAQAVMLLTTLYPQTPWFKANWPGHPTPTRLTELTPTARLSHPHGWFQLWRTGRAQRSAGLLAEFCGTRLAWGAYDRLPIWTTHGSILWADPWHGQPWLIWQERLQPGFQQLQWSDAHACPLNG